MLTSVVLTLHNDPCWYMGVTTCRLCFIAVFTACTGSALGIDTDVAVVDFDGDVVI